MPDLVDGCGRQIDHLRLSVTTACNLRCLYCRPGGGDEASCSGLSDAQRFDIVQHLVGQCGLKQLRLTGGEPLLHKSLVSLVERIRDACPSLSIALTTNARLLARLAHALRRAGVDRLNISLDSLRPQRYREITGGPLQPVLDGLAAADAAGFEPPKINVVVLRGVNDDEIADLTRWAFERGSEIRFLEAMPIGPAAALNCDRFISARDVRRQLAEHFELSPIFRGAGETAQRWRACDETVEGIVGTIAPVTESFCGQCRRIRITADGRLYPCLLDARFIELAPAWPAGTFDGSRADRLIADAIAAKAPKGSFQQLIPMIRLGG
jgi:cyclic pyranopterin phosphate synthase